MAVSHTPETRTTFTDILKNDFAPAIIQATAEKSFTLSHFEKVAGKLDYGGKAFIIPLEFDYWGSTGARGEATSSTGDLPDSTPGIWTRASVPIYYNYFTTSVTGPAMATSNQDKFAWAEAWMRDVKIKTRAFRQNLNRQMHGDGDGILAQVDGAVAGSDITVDNAYGLSGYNNSDVNGHKFVTKNMKVDFYTGSSKRDNGSVEIQGVTPGSFPNTSAILDVTGEDFDEVSDGDYMYVAGAYGNEPPGLQLLIDDGTSATSFQSVSTDTYPEWKSQVGYGSTAGTAEALTTNRIVSLVDDIEIAGGQVDYGITSNAVWLTYGEMARSESLITNVKQISGPLDTTWSAVEIAGTMLYKDPHCIDVIYMIDNRCIKLHQAGEQGWLDADGDIIKMEAGKDMWNAYWKWYFTPAMHNRSWCGKLVDISVVANKF